MIRFVFSEDTNKIKYTFQKMVPKYISIVKEVLKKDMRLDTLNLKMWYSKKFRILVIKTNFSRIRFLQQKKTMRTYAAPDKVFHMQTLHTCMHVCMRNTPFIRRDFLNV